METYKFYIDIFIKKKYSIKQSASFFNDFTCFNPSLKFSSPTSVIFWHLSEFLFQEISLKNYEQKRRVISSRRLFPFKTAPKAQRTSSFISLKLIRVSLWCTFLTLKDLIRDFSKEKGLVNFYKEILNFCLLSEDNYHIKLAREYQDRYTRVISF